MGGREWGGVVEGGSGTRGVGRVGGRRREMVRGGGLGGGEPRTEGVIDVMERRVCEKRSWRLTVTRGVITMVVH